MIQIVPFEILAIEIYLGFGICNLVLTLFLSLIGKGFVNQHHGDIFFNRIE